MNDYSQQHFDGVTNLLVNVLHAKAGERILIVGETGANIHFDHRVCELVQHVATRLQLAAQVLICEIGHSASECPQELTTAMQQTDHTLFFSRLGDQLRFTASAGQSTKTMCYVLQADYFASDFCRTPYQLYKLLHDRLIKKISASRHFQISCSQGTSLHGELLFNQDEVETEAVFTDFTVEMFPLTIFPPVACSTMSGKLVLKDWLTSSSTVIYDNSVYFINSPVTASVENGQITAFDGKEKECQAMEKHFLRVADIVGGEAFAINSWHTGIIPSTWYQGLASDDLEKWGSVSFASPRITHFHACGSDPGQIGINLFDATIHFDDDLIWDEGHYLFPLSSDCKDIFADYPDWQSSFKHNGELGVGL